MSVYKDTMSGTPHEQLHQISLLRTETALKATTHIHRTVTMELHLVIAAFMASLATSVPTTRENGEPLSCQRNPDTSNANANSQQYS